MTNNWYSSNSFPSAVFLLKYSLIRETDLDYEECHTWNNYINRKEGHKIINIDLIPEDKYYKCNKISIELPYIFNQIVGCLDTPEWINNLLLKTNIDTLPKINEENIGDCLNFNLQTVFHLQFISNKCNVNIDFTNLDIN